MDLLDSDPIRSAPLERFGAYPEIDVPVTSLFRLHSKKKKCLIPSVLSRIEECNGIFQRRSVGNET